MSANGEHLQSEPDYDNRYHPDSKKKRPSFSEGLFLELRRSDIVQAMEVIRL